MNTKQRFWDIVEEEARYYSVTIEPGCESLIKGFIAREAATLPPNLPPTPTAHMALKNVVEAELRVRSLMLLMIVHAKHDGSDRLRGYEYDVVTKLLCVLFPPFCPP